MDELDEPADLSDDTGRWKGRDVAIWSGRWERLARIVPKFTLEPFRVDADSPPNPHMRAVVRQPLSVVERPLPVGTVSNTYTLVQHHEVVERCFAGLRSVGLKTETMKCEVALSALGEWMNFRAYFPEEYNQVPRDGKALALRLECFNSVDGSSRLVILLGWLRFVCSNGLVIGETKAELRDAHDEYLDLDQIPEIIEAGMQAVSLGAQRLKLWDQLSLDKMDLQDWVDGALAKQWGKKAACRVFHICTTGHDVEITDPFSAAAPTQKPVKRKAVVPGSSCPAKTAYDVSQALSWVATRRSNVEERVEWQGAIPSLIEKLQSTVSA